MFDTMGMMTSVRNKVSYFINRACVINVLYCVCFMCALSCIRFYNERHLYEKYDSPREEEARQWLYDPKLTYLTKNTFWRLRANHINDTSPCKLDLKHRATISIEFPGRTANHMFNIASLLGIAHRNCLRPVLQQPAIPHAFNFNIDIIDEWPSAENTTIYQEFGEFRGGGGYDANTENLTQFTMHSNTTTHIHLKGFYQSWKYFHHIREDIWRRFQFLPDVQEKAQRFLVERLPPQYRTIDTIRVGIHNRRGDMLHPVLQWAGVLVSKPTYIRAAMEFFESRFPQVVFIICGDDSWYNRATYGGPSNVIISENEDAMVDLAVLSMSDHMIMTIGTFGWWAGYLVDGIVVYDPKFAKPNSRIDRQLVKRDHFLPQWVPLYT